MAFRTKNIYVVQNIKLWLKLNNKPFKLISDTYEGSHKNLKWECLKESCGETFKATWGNVSMNNGCPYCAGKKAGKSNSLATKNPELAKQWHPVKNGSLTPEKVTANSNNKVWWKCSQNPKHQWEAVINNRNIWDYGCPYCAGQLASEDYNLLLINPELCKEWDCKKNDKLPQEYTPNSGKKAWWLCDECNHEWQAKIDSRNRGRGCPICENSTGEKEIRKFLDLWNIKNIPQKKYDGLLGLGGGLLSYDFYLHEYNLLIEYQGQYHDGNGNYHIKQNLSRQQEHDKRKKEYAQNNNIKLLEIWYYDFDNIENILKRELNIINNKC